MVSKCLSSDTTPVNIQSPIREDCETTILLRNAKHSVRNAHYKRDSFNEHLKEAPMIPESANDIFFAVYYR